jgi:hypothetical protein
VVCVFTRSLGEVPFETKLSVPAQDRELALCKLDIVFDMADCMHIIIQTAGDAANTPN